MIINRSDEQSIHREPGIHEEKKHSENPKKAKIEEGLNEGII